MEKTHTLFFLVAQGILDEAYMLAGNYWSGQNTEVKDDQHQ